MASLAALAYFRFLNSMSNSKHTTGITYCMLYVAIMCIYIGHSSNMHSSNTYIDYTILISLTGILCTVSSSSNHVHYVQLKAPGMERSMQACRTGTPALPHQMVPGVSFRAYLPLLVRKNVETCPACPWKCYMLYTQSDADYWAHTSHCSHLHIKHLSISGNFQCVCAAVPSVYAPLLQ